MFPVEVVMNYCITVASGKPFEVDIFIPALSLAFEYNGEYHYQFVSMYPRTATLEILCASHKEFQKDEGLQLLPG